VTEEGALRIGRCGHGEALREQGFGIVARSGMIAPATPAGPPGPFETLASSLERTTGAEKAPASGFETPRGRVETPPRRGETLARSVETLTAGLRH